MNACGIEFRRRDDVWESQGAPLVFLGDKLVVWLSVDERTHFDDQAKILAMALEVLPQQEAQAKQALYQYYQMMRRGFLGRLAGRKSIEEMGSVFGFSVLHVPEQFDGRGKTFRILGGADFSDDGTQLFFRNGVLEKADSDAAILF